MPNAVPGGRTNSGETLYIGRAWHAGALTPGKIHPSHGNLYIPYNGGEVAIGTYEVLIENWSKDDIVIHDDKADTE